MSNRVGRSASRAAVVIAVLAAARADGFAYRSTSFLGVDSVLHPIGYTGTGGNLTITVGVDPTSANADSMLISTANVVNTYNQLVATSGNLIGGGANNIPAGSFDFESVLLHELGHSLGLSHVNAATESGLSGSDQNYTTATTGANAVFDLDDGADNIIGSGDDLRGDDVNLNYFRISNNNPFTIDAVVDSTTYSRDLANLPGSDTFSANPDRAVADLLLGAGSSTEAVMQQGTFDDEAQRTLGHDDVAGIRYAMSGLDEIQGTADDYTITLNFLGKTTTADVVLDFDNSQTSFAVSSASMLQIGATDHASIVSTAIFFNTGSSWFFNNLSSTPAPEPSSFLLLALGLGLLARSGRRGIQTSLD